MKRTFFFIFDDDVGIVVFVVVAIVSKLLETIVHNTMFDDAIIDCRLETLLPWNTVYRIVVYN